MTIRRAKRNTEISGPVKRPLVAQRVTNTSRQRTHPQQSLNIYKFYIENESSSRRDRRATFDPVANPIRKNQRAFFSLFHGKKRFIPTLHHLTFSNLKNNGAMIIVGAI